MAAKTRTILATLLGIIFAAAVLLTGISGGIDRTLYDATARWSAVADRGEGRRAGVTGKAGESDSPVELIYIDQYSLSWVEKNLGLAWPWPRELYGIIASFCSQAKAQAFDILFSEASSFGPGDDARCAEAMDGAGNVVIAEAVDSRSGERLTPLPTTKVGFGAVTGLVDADGVLRRYMVGAAKAGDPVGSGSSASGSSKDGSSAGGSVAGGSVAGRTPSLGRAVLALGKDPPLEFSADSVYLRFYGASPTFPARNAAEILASVMSIREGREPQIDPRQYSGKYLFIGFSAPGLLDRQAVPTDRAMPGAEIHATFVENALRGRLLGTLSPAVEALIVFIAAFGAAWISSHAKRPASLTVGVAFFACLPVASGYAFYRAGFVASAGLEMSAGLASYAAGIILSYVSEGRNRIFLRRSFSQYLAPSVIDELIRNPGLLKLGGEERTITVFFSDIQGFTALSETMDPGRLAAFMNAYLSIVTNEILKEGGTVDKYVGDAVVAFWNAPLDQADHAVRAVRAALYCQKNLADSSGVFTALGVSVPFTRIGIHTGKAIVGNMGSPSRFNYTALGDVVNTASRLENANKATGTKILVSGDTVAACPSGSLEFRRLGEVAVYGKKIPIEVWEPGLSGSESGFAPAWTGVKDCSEL